MAYTIYKSDGTAITIPDNTIDAEFYNATGGGGFGPGNVPQIGHGLGLQLVGRNTLSYGASTAQNLLQLQENFSSAVVPSDLTSLQGQLWFKQTSNTTGSLYVRKSGATVGGITNWDQVVVGSGGVPATANALATPRNITATGDASWFVTFDGSAGVSAALTLATVNGAPVSNAFQKLTVNSKGLVTSTSAVNSADITTSLGYTPVNRAGDTMTGNLFMSLGATVRDIPTPVNATDVANKAYVDTFAAGLAAHASCVTSTTTVLPSSTYNNGAAGVGATLTANANGALGVIGGFGGLIVLDRVLVKDQANPIQNGIYTVTNLGSGGSQWVLTRASDFDNSPNGEIQGGVFTYIQQGGLAGTQWVVTTTGTITVGATSINWSQLTGASTYIGGTGINVSGNLITNTGVASIAGTANQVTVSASTGNPVVVSLPPSVAITDKLTVNQSGLVAPVVAAGTGVHIVGATGISPTMLVDGSGVAATPVINLRRANGTAAAPTPVLSANSIGGIGFFGYGSTFYNHGAAVNAIATENWTDTVRGTRLDFQTTLQGTSSTTSTLHIDDTGRVTAPIMTGISITDASTTLATTSWVQSVLPRAHYWSAYNAATMVSVNGIVNYQSSAATGATYTAGTVTITTPGVYAITASVSAGWPSPVTNFTGKIEIYRNGNPTGYTNQAYVGGTIASYQTNLNVNGVIPCNTGDSITIYYTGGHQVFTGFGSFTGYRLGQN